MTELIILALAAYRLTRLFIIEKGPFKSFQRIREIVGIKHDDNGTPSSWPETTLAGIFTCPFCFSVYASTAVYLIWLTLPRAIDVLAVMGLVALILEALDYINGRRSDGSRQHPD